MQGIPYKEPRFLGEKDNEKVGDDVSVMLKKYGRKGVEKKANDVLLKSILGFKEIQNQVENVFFEKELKEGYLDFYTDKAINGIINNCMEVALGYGLIFSMEYYRPRRFFSKDLNDIFEITKDLRSVWGEKKREILKMREKNTTKYLLSDIIKCCIELANVAHDNNKPYSEWSERDIYKSEDLLYILINKLFRLKQTILIPIEHEMTEKEIQDKEGRNFWNRNFKNQILVYARYFFKKLNSEYEYGEEVMIHAWYHMDICNDGYISSFEFNIFLNKFGTLSEALPCLAKLVKDGFLIGFICKEEVLKVLMKKPKNSLLITTSQLNPKVLLGYLVVEEEKSEEMIKILDLSGSVDKDQVTFLMNTIESTIPYGGKTREDSRREDLLELKVRFYLGEHNFGLKNELKNKNKQKKPRIDEGMSTMNITKEFPNNK